MGARIKELEPTRAAYHRFRELIPLEALEGQQIRVLEEGGNRGKVADKEPYLLVQSAPSQRLPPDWVISRATIPSRDRAVLRLTLWLAGDPGVPQAAPVPPPPSGGILWTPLYLPPSLREIHFGPVGCQVVFILQLGEHVPERCHRVPHWAAAIPGVEQQPAPHLRPFARGTGAIRSGGSLSWGASC